MTTKIFSADGQALSLPRRRFVQGLAAGGLLTGLGISPLSSRAESGVGPQPQVLRGRSFDLTIGSQQVNFTGHPRPATTINGSIPGPILRWREGERVSLRVTNNLAHDSSIHWHGMILPTHMDGVPGISFDGIRPGETFTYEFDVNQNGTYWYHSHSGFQEQTGMYGAIIIDPKQSDPVSYDRDYVVVLSDWSDEDPSRIYAKLKKMSDYYNFNERTGMDLLRDIRDKGVSRTFSERKMWNTMRMSDRDLSDVTGYTYTYLMNGQTPAGGWAGLFKRGEKIRLRFVNGSAMTFFDVRIPELKMTVVAADGQNIEPVTVDEFRIGVAETYDVVVEPKDDRAYTIFAQTIDRTGHARGTLTPDMSLTAPVPEYDPAPILGHGEMGMGMGMAGMDHGMHSGGKSKPMAMDHSMHGGSGSGIVHVATEYGPHVDMRAENPQLHLDDPGIGLRNNGRRVLSYADLRNLYPTPDVREPGREIKLHLTGNMSRYMWSINGVKFADADPIQLKFGERVRFSFVNDTMMNHPMHLHGMWSDLETGDNKRIPRKHVVIVQPGSKISYLVTADAKGGWAFHCHLLYHMLGMFRKVVVS
ncbi:MAG TPA: copper resistance system multicopper oxidase [Acidiferrobacteraceae bacterium]|nr:copper resistance system multicopper oxidase [Acidiferrobacteraceae bacterium]